MPAAPVVSSTIERAAPVAARSSRCSSGRRSAGRVPRAIARASVENGVVGLMPGVRRHSKMLNRKGKIGRPTTAARLASKWVDDEGQEARAVDIR